MILLQCLHKLDVCGTEHAWFTDYLTSHLKHISFTNNYSEWDPVSGDQSIPVQIKAVSSAYCSNQICDGMSFM